MKIKKISKNVWEIPRENEMNAPVRVFASEKLLKAIKQDDCIKQGINVSTLPGIYGKSIMMPDAHQGYGFPIGGVAAFDVENGCISPGGVGFDINCGVRLLASDLDITKIKLKINELMEELFNNIPCGVGKDSKLKLSDEDFEKVLNTGLKWALEKGYAIQDDLDRCEENGHMQTADASKVSPRARKRGRNQLGTLGAGNHFVDVMYVDEIYDKEVAEVFGITKKNQVVVLIHSGSRGLGHQVCSDYLKKMEDEFPDIIKNLPDRNLTYSPTKSKLSKDYLSAMSAAANYGWCNRQLIAYHSRLVFNKLFGDDGSLNTIYDVAHNIVKIEEYKIDGEMKKVYVHRKGATRAFGPGHKEIPEVYRNVGQPIIIPGSMGTASYVLVGTDKAMNETFSSTPHGAGRIMSRHEASNTFNEEGVRKNLTEKNIYLKSASKAGIIQEAPEVYKDIDEVIKVTDEVGIGKKVAKLIPVGVING